MNEDFVTGLSGDSFIAINGTSIYWTRWSSGKGTTIGRCEPQRHRGQPEVRQWCIGSIRHRADRLKRIAARHEQLRLRVEDANRWAKLPAGRPRHLELEDH